jgi:hypothetical protein
MSLRTTHPVARGLLAAVSVASVATGALTLAAPAQAKDTASVGDYAVTVNGRTYNPAPGKDAEVKEVAVTGRITVRGVHTSFTLDPSTMGVYDYTLTGAPSPERMVTSPTVVFAGKVPQLTAAQLAGPRVKELEVRDGTLVALLTTAGGKFKIQAKDAPQGGIFQMEPEFTGNVEIVHTLGPSLFYFLNPFTGKNNFGDGKDPVSASESSTGSHQMLLGKDSPQVATKLFQGATTTRWSVASGGRVGGVLGEDAIELSAGATSCTSQCQAQNQVRGSLPVPPLPVHPTPIG